MTGRSRFQARAWDAAALRAGTTPADLGVTMTENTNTIEVSDQRFTEGDLVQLKSGGRPMTFRRYQPDGEAYVNYMTGDGLQHAILPAGMLRHAVPETETVAKA